MNVTVIGVAGGTGSGKSTLVKRLQEAFVGDDVVTLCHDYYYKAHPELTYEERTKLNYPAGLRHGDARGAYQGAEEQRAHRTPGLLVRRPRPHVGERERETFEGDHRRRHPDLREQGAARPDGHQGLRRHRRRHPAGAAYPARRLRARTHDAVGHHAVHLDGEADARGVRRAVEEIRRRDHSRRRLQLGGRSDADPEHPFADPEQQIGNLNSSLKMLKP